MKLGFSIFSAVLLGGCASAPTGEVGTAGTPVGTSLGYAAAAPATVSYAFADSSGFNIKGGAIGDIRATVRTSGTADVSYAQNANDVELRVKLIDFTGAFTNSAVGGTTAVTEADVQGEAVLSVSPRGAVTVSQLPTATRQAQSVGVGASMFRRFTVRLPGARVQRGAAWVDTVSTNEETGGTRAYVRDIITSTWARDTVVNARTLNVITHSIQRRLEISGTSEGVEIAQKLTGTALGHTLWDAQRNIVVERLETTDLSGTFDLPAMGLTGLPVTASGSGRITLR